MRESVGGEPAVPARRQRRCRGWRDHEGQRPPLRLAGRLSLATGSARWINRLPGPAFAGLPDGFPRYRMRLRRIKNGLARYTVIFMFLV